MAVALSFITNVQDTTSQTVYTFSGVSLGAAASDRQIAVGIGARGGTSLSVSSVTIGGVSATQLVHHISATSNEDTSAIYFANVPSGTTGDIVVTWSGSGKLRCGIGVWRMTGVDGTVNATDSDDGSGTGSLSLTTNVNSGGAAIGYNLGAGAISASTWTWANITEDFDILLETDITHTGASDEFVSAQTPLTMTITPSQSDFKCFVGASFNASISQTIRLIKISGTFVEKPILTKVAGTFIDKPIKIKVGGTFVDA